MSSSEKLPPPPKNAAERLAVIVDAAERAALKVIDDAEKEARRYLEEAQAMADRLVAERLREAADSIEGGSASAETPRLREVPPEHEAEDVRNGSSAARLLATQMAVSGSSRKEIEERLRNGFEIEDTDEILDAILGPED
jgi:vacuolar-type H+-ATPase subunit E/Vma4